MKDNLDTSSTNSEAASVASQSSHRPVTQRDYDLLPGYGAAQLLNSLAGEIVCDYAKMNSKNGDPLLVFFFTKDNRPFKQVENWLPEPTAQEK